MSENLQVYKCLSFDGHDEDAVATAIRMPCPFCGSLELSTNLWSLEDGEVDAIECDICYAGAPVKSWIDRAVKW